MKKLFTGLFRAARKRLQTTDNDMGMFREKLNALVAGKDTAGEEEVAAAVTELADMTNDLPESEDKAKLLRFIEDFKSVKEQDAAVAQEAAKAVADLFEKLDTEAMKDSPDVSAPVDEPAEEGPALEETVAEEAEEPAAEEATAGEETDGACKAEEVQDDGDEGQDKAENAEYTLEEIYQFIKQRMAEDAAAGESDEAAETAGAEEEPESIAEETAEEEVDEVTQDHAPGFALPENKKAAAGTLAGMFAALKNGGR